MRQNRIHFPNNMKIIQNNEGLTLVELMIVLVLSLILMAAAYMSYQAQSTSGRTQAQVSLMQQDLRAAMYNLSKDIRNAGCETRAVMSAAEVPELIATSNSSGLDRLTLYMDITGPGGTPDGDTNDPGEHILYRLNGTDLERIDFNDNNSVLQIAQNVQLFRLSYLYYNEATGTFPEIAIASLPGNESTIRLIGVRMIVQSSQPDPDTGQPLTRELRKRIKLRNVHE